MGASEKETTADWLLPEAARPPLIGELERRVAEALATARATEDAVMTVGAAAIDAAEQAQRAAALAEKASAAALDAQARVASMTAASPAGPIEGEAESSLSDFSARADRLVARLRQLQRVPLPAPSPSGPAGRPQPAH